MNVVYKSLVLTTACFVTVLLLLYFAVPAERSKEVSVAVAPDVAGPPTDATPIPGSKLYFDVHGHSAEEFTALLDRAHDIYNETPSLDRAALEVVLVLHGPDIDFFAAKNYEKYQHIVDLSAQLDAFGVFDFKMCAVSAASLGLAESEVPPFIEFVPYGPEEIERLEAAGYVQI